MSLDNYERVIYKKNPLIHAVCQLRFPRILKINEKQPADFQDRIRDRFPLFQVIVEQQHLAMGLGPTGAPPSTQIFPLEEMHNYKFSSEDGKWHINLTPTFLALSTSKYIRWEDFIENLKTPLKALIEIYRPAFFERIGLRYIDAFERSKLNLAGTDWSELLQPFVLSFMSNPKIKDNVRSQSTLVELDIGNGAIARITAAKGFISDLKFGFPISASTEAFIIDSDMYVLHKKKEEVNDSLIHLHNNATNLIRSIITDTLHKAMEPETI
jgi:uncharacterized protein (TIGR04255 family)